MAKRKPLQLSFDTPDIQRALVPRHVAIVDTVGKSIEQIVREMLRVPMEKSVLLDFTIGHVPRSPIPANLDEDRVELIRLQRMLNARYHGRRFDWLGDSFLARMVRESIRSESWNPFSKGG